MISAYDIMGPMKVGKNLYKIDFDAIKSVILVSSNAIMLVIDGTLHDVAVLSEIYVESNNL